MILKVRQFHSNASLKESGWNGNGFDGWVYYEADHITIDWLPDCTYEHMANNPNLVFNVPDVFSCHIAHIGERILYFNTEAYLINEKGKTVDLLPCHASL